MARIDYSTWLTKQQAADAIGVSTKTVEKLADKKEIQQAYWKRPETGATVSVYHPDDVERVRRERNPDAEPFVLPGDQKSGMANLPDPQSRALAVQPPAAQVLQALAAMAGGSQTSQKSGVRTAERLFLTIPEASDYSGLPLSHIRRLLAEGKLEGLKTGAGWRIRRADLEKL